MSRSQILTNFLTCVVVKKTHMFVLKEQCRHHNSTSTRLPRPIRHRRCLDAAAAAITRCRRRCCGLLPEAQGGAVELRLAAVRVPGAIADRRCATVLAPRWAARGNGREVYKLTWRCNRSNKKGHDSIDPHVILNFRFPSNSATDLKKGHWLTIPFFFFLESSQISGSDYEATQYTFTRPIIESILHWFMQRRRRRLQ